MRYMPRPDTRADIADRPNQAEQCSNNDVAIKKSNHFGQTVSSCWPLCGWSKHGRIQFGQQKEPTRAKESQTESGSQECITNRVKKHSCPPCGNVGGSVVRGEALVWWSWSSLGWSCTETQLFLLHLSRVTISGGAMRLVHISSLC